MRDLNLDQLRAFVDVMEHGSFSAAAARLNLTQPAISQQIRQLERHYGVRLVERVGRRATPTAAGRALLVHAQHIAAAVATAADAMTQHATGTAGKVRLGTGATACIYLLPPILRALRRGLPDLEIAIHTGNTPDIVAAVEGNALDLGLVTLPASGRAVAVTPLIDDPFVLIGGPGTASLPAAAEPALLARLPLILYEPAGNTRRVVDRWFAEAGVAPRPVMELGNVEAIKELVGAGLGYALLPGMAIPGRRAGGLTVRPLAPALHRTLGLVLRRDKPLSRGLRAVLAALQQAGGPGALRPAADQ